METKHTRRSGTKYNASRRYTLVTLVGLLTMLLWPSMAVAVPPPLTGAVLLGDADQLKQAWKYAGEVGVYRYQTDVIQTTHPTLNLVNVGRSAKTERIMVSDLMDRPNDTMQMKIQADGSIEIKVEQGISYGRLNPQEEWTQVENQTDMFAPGGDPLGYLNAAENIREIANADRSGRAELRMEDATLDEVLCNPQFLIRNSQFCF